MTNESTNDADLVDVYTCDVEGCGAEVETEQNEPPPTGWVVLGELAYCPKHGEEDQ
jgi:hypothetical protein